MLPEIKQDAIMMTRAERRRMEREQGKKSVTYTFTHEQLLDHDRAVIDDFKKRYEKKLVEQAKEEEKRIMKAVDVEWQQRYDEFQSGNTEDDLLNYLKCTLAFPLKVLIEQFGWKPLYQDRYDKQTRIYKLVNAVRDEINKVAEDDTLDIRKYAEDVLNKYNVGFIVTDKFGGDET